MVQQLNSGVSEHEAGLAGYADELTEFHRQLKEQWDILIEVSEEALNCLIDCEDAIYDAHEARPDETLFQHGAGLGRLIDRFEAFYDGLKEEQEGGEEQEHEKQAAID